MNYDEADYRYQYDQKLNGGIISNGLLNPTLLPLANAAVVAYSISHQ